MGLQFALQFTQRMPLDDGFRRSESAHDQQPGRARAARQVADKVNRRIVGPVQIFEHQDQRRFRSECFDGFRDFAQHTLLRSAQRLALQAFPGGLADQPRHLRQPHGSMLPEDLDGAIPAGLPAQAGQRLQDGEVRFAFAEMLQALAARNGNAVVSSGRSLQKCFYQRGFSDAGLARNEDDLTAAGETLCQRFLQARDGCVAFHGSGRAVHRQFRCDPQFER